ncbi:hypothetical protein HMPREF0973_00878 [Prevotella veroralis F0319]|uniref:Uncharacterized protein n=1 Tax=Prevotella veroralis F0319 TaxID=649761 RepID=C9MMP5_9BACT|nr:hypothetical protein HMPREF0973_00878 [Prevotella veroralis F0319]
MTYQVNEVLQRIIRYFASFSTICLANSNNLLTHTHTHTHTIHLHTLLLIRACVKIINLSRERTLSYLLLRLHNITCSQTKVRYGICIFQSGDSASQDFYSLY